MFLSDKGSDTAEEQKELFNAELFNGVFYQASALKDCIYLTFKNYSFSPCSWFYPCKGCRGNAMGWVLWSPTSQWPSKFSAFISILSSTNCASTSWPVQSPLFSVFILQLFQFSALTSEHETQLFSLLLLFQGPGPVLWTQEAECTSPLRVLCGSH